jgi:hypothetical protein
MSQLVEDSFIAKPRVALRAVYAAIDWSLTSSPISNESTNPILRRQDVDTHTCHVTEDPVDPQRGPRSGQTQWAA